MEMPVCYLNDGRQRHVTYIFFRALFPNPSFFNYVLTCAEILNTLLQKLSSADATQRSALINHRNNSGNTPLHWAALNTHLECVKALVEAGADLDVKNDAGHDAVFLAERTAWAAVEVNGEAEDESDQTQDQEIEMTVGDTEGDDKAAEGPGEMSAGRQVVEWLLNSDVAASLEKGATEGEGQASGSA
jgi:hypothetical protein